MILMIYVHPYSHHSHVNKRMLEQARTLEGVEIRSFYQLYPDSNIDIAAEQEALSRAGLIVRQRPMQWYSIPPLLKLWIDKVFSHGWAYGHDGTALHSKHLLWAVTAGGGENHFEIGAHPGFGVLPQSLQATVIYCGLNWLPPFAMHCTFVCDDETLKGQAQHYKQRLLEWQEAHHGQPYAYSGADLSRFGGADCSHCGTSRPGIGSWLPDRRLHYQPVGAAAGD